MKRKPVFNADAAEEYFTKRKMPEGVNQWISVEERLPKAADNPVLGYDDRSNMPFMAWYHPILGEWEGSSGLPVVITHWMPLPPLPSQNSLSSEVLDYFAKFDLGGDRDGAD